MKASTKLALTAVFTACSVLGMQGPAMATVIEAGPICKPVGNSNRAGLFSTSGGVRNTTAARLLVVCPLGHNTSLSATTVFVTGDDAGGRVECTLHSHSLLTGLPLDIASRIGFGGISLAPVAPFTYHALTCFLPPGSELFGIAYSAD